MSSTMWYIMQSIQSKYSLSERLIRTIAAIRSFPHDNVEDLIRRVSCVTRAVQSASFSTLWIKMSTFFWIFFTGSRCEPDARHTEATALRLYGGRCRLCGASAGERCRGKASRTTILLWELKTAVNSLNSVFWQFKSEACNFGVSGGSEITHFAVKLLMVQWQVSDYLIKKCGLT